MEKEQYYLADTNILLDELENAMQSHKLVLMATTRQELDKHKISKDDDLKFKARRSNRYIFEHYDEFIHDVGEYDPEQILGYEYSSEVKDNRIVACAYKNGYGIITNDLNLYTTAKAFGIDVVTYDENVSNSLEYTGIKKVYLTTDSVEEEMYAQLYQNMSSNPFNLITNQYLIVYDKELPIEFNEDGTPTKYKVLDKLRFDGKQHVKLKLPHKKVVQAMNEEQECALDMLNNDDIPIKFVIGVAGSGKTKLSAKIGIHKILDTGAHHKIIAVRNPIGSGENIGFLKGDFEEKTDRFFAPIVGCLKGGELEAALLEQKGQLEKQIPYYAKGLTYNDSYIFVDEAEDLNAKIIGVLGTRVGEKASIVFSGDYKQAEDKYLRNNGLLKAIDSLKGNKLVGVVALSEGVRSDASALFLELL
ncbi:PhoH family protein [Ureibacillus chungkukjangi]|uniref:PhoH family protein n=1 Tax=Ureibacillus chungkukjangi TaxID=1202712 RepID=UPI00203DFB10|nr:PhoH family protein [Ureibacillus chungkukjangi]MCM3387314.1 PhoH family protein [Ureibacillus chungkukjangi]